jgi:hypothetical protein
MGNKTDMIKELEAKMLHVKHFESELVVLKVDNMFLRHQLFLLRNSLAHAQSTKK